MTNKTNTTGVKSPLDETILHRRLTLLINLRSMRNPLACLKLAGELLKEVDGENTFSGYKDFLLEVMERNTEKMEEMINTLLNNNAIDNEPYLGSVPVFGPVGK